MYQIGVGVTLPAAVVGESLAASAGSEIAATALPYTGIAFAVYVAIAMMLVLSGVTMQLLGRRGAQR